MARLTVTGLDGFTKNLDEFIKEISNINRAALGEGAKVMAEAIGQALENYPVREDNEYGTSAYKLYGMTQNEKVQFQEQFGIAKFREENGQINTSLGWRGYIDTPSDRFNDQVPAMMLLQCIEEGTDFRQGTAKIKAAVKAATSHTKKAIEEKIITESEKILK